MLVEGQSPVLLWSGGRRSTLLLAMLREQPIPFDIVQWREGWSKERRKQADKLIKQWNLKVFDYPPASVNFMGDLQLAFQYAPNWIPVVEDVAEGTQCGIEMLSGMKMATSPIDWNLFITGHKKGSVIPKGLYTPLWEWDEQQVLDGLKTRGIDGTFDNGSLQCCSRCLRPSDTGSVVCPKNGMEIPVVEWDGNANLAAFREAYGA